MRARAAGSARPKAAEASAARLMLRVVAPLAAGFFLSNYYRSLNAILSPRLIADLGLSARDLGLLTSVYFFTAALVQVPLGLLMDRYGPRRVQGALMAIATLGLLMFALGETMGVLLLGRAIMGVGAAGALMICFQAIVLWFPASRWPSLNGLALTIGGLGALAASLPSELILGVTDWRGLLLGTAVASLAVSVWTLAAVPDRRADAKRGSLAEQLSGLAAVLRDRLFWRVAPITGAVTGCSLSFQGLWSGPWLKDVGLLGSAGIATSLLVLTTLMTLSFAAIGAVADWLGRRGIALTKIVGIGVPLSLLCQLPLLLPSGAGRWIVMVGMGALGNVVTLSYPVLSNHVSPALSGRASTAMNLVVFVSAFAAQYALGAVIDLFPPVAPGSYPVAAYQVAFAGMILVETMAWLWFLIPMEKRR
ncbi:MAG TPA: MFS transporter [Stellaceae bacterium]|nr:MFS transporter [Stellaceae bacterium]